MSNKFEELSKVNVNGKTEKKGRFTYLSWAFAWSELKKIAPNAQVKVYEHPETHLPYFSSNAGVMVKVGVTIDDLEHINYLPVMDFKNQAIPADKVSMTDVNKAIQRATVKAIALHGLGLYIYAGEDLPEDSESSESFSDGVDKLANDLQPTEKQLNFLREKAEFLNKDEKVALANKEVSRTQASSLIKEIFVREKAGA